MVRRSRPVRRPSRSVQVLTAGVLAAGAAWLSGCGSTVDGVPVAVERSPVGERIDAQLITLLPEPSQFPARYPAVVLPPEAAAQAVGDLDGVARGATVEPADCAPPEQQYGPDHTAVAVGTSDADRATLTVELVRTRSPLSDLADQLRRCGEIRVTGAGPTTTVTTTVDRAPAVDADDALSLRRVVAPDVGGAGLTQRMHTHLAQIDDVRVLVTYMIFGDGPEDEAALRELFTTAVGKVAAA
ncbi:MAG TPA: sensor domain-containing protein [Nocardia sp.]|uniref:sensor domain-containing protein n=1 Tax=Nocardia sp. TaxID=1821 RepID=UPI002B4AAE20|nr:sensor domain-containing protein [Nocardia sp.]HLS79277.1 sensor domain-containing protein [Nocardia sp.]